MKLIIDENEVFVAFTKKGHKSALTLLSEERWKG